MLSWRQFNDWLVVIPIAALFVVGLVVTARSGVRSLSRRQDLHVLALNLTGVLLRVAGYVAGLFAVQHIIGAPAAVGW